MARLTITLSDARYRALKETATCGLYSKATRPHCWSLATTRSCSVLPGLVESCLHAGSFPFCRTPGERARNRSEASSVKFCTRLISRLASPGAGSVLESTARRDDVTAF
jgi:hypothetical protein